MTVTEVWTIIGGLVAVAGLGGMMILHIIRYAYQQGVIHQRLTVVERQQAESAAVGGVLGTLSATVEGLKSSIDRLDRALERMDERVSRASTPARGKSAAA